MPPVNVGVCDDALRREMLLIFAAGCLLTLIIVLRVFRSSRTVGLQFGYLANFWIIHWVSIPVYLVPWYCGENASFTLLGARQSLYALTGLTTAVLLVSYLLHVRGKRAITGPVAPTRITYALLTLGFIFQVVTSRLKIASGFQGLLAGVGAFAVVGVVLNIWNSVVRREPRGVLKWLAVGLLFPFFTVINSGFLGFGILSLIPILFFALTWGQRKSLLVPVLGGLFAFYLGLSLFVTYMRDRTDIRRSVWGQESFSRRLDQLEDTFGNFEFFSPTNTQHLAAIDERLNQNYLVGASVVYIENTQEWAAGKTLIKASLAFIPRLLWPDKPVATSGGLVSEYTGLHFATGTSIGIGQVMEFYVNFGSGMVFFGFFLFGSLIVWLDYVAAKALAEGTVHKFISAYLVGLCFQQMGGSLTEVMGSATIALILAYMFEMFFTHQVKRVRNSRTLVIEGHPL
jgi:hypothetical protein